VFVCSGGFGDAVSPVVGVLMMVVGSGVSVRSDGGSVASGDGDSAALVVDGEGSVARSGVALGVCSSLDGSSLDGVTV
jgi:hypothetical protein